MASETTDDGVPAKGRFSGPGLRIGLVTSISGLTVLAAEEIGRRLPVPADSGCGKCSEFGSMPHFLAQIGYPVLAFFAGFAVIALAFAAAHVARRWEVLAWLVPLGLLSVLFLRYLQYVTSPASTFRSTMFPLDDFWIIADGVGIAAYAAFLAALTDDRIGSGTRRLVFRVGVAVTACGIAYWFWVIANGDPLHH
jgi:hypothetical protein